MTQDKHTPGPWNIHYWDNKYHVEATGRNLVATLANKTSSGVFYNDGAEDTDATTKANGKLLSAAPDLLAALSSMLTTMGMDEDETNRPVYEQARAAIAKARGQQ